MTKKRAKKSKKPVKPKSPLDWYVIERIKKIRLEKGYSQADLSEKLNFSDSFISQMESKVTAAHYNISQLNTIAIVLGCSLHDFFPKHPISHSYTVQK